MTQTPAEVLILSTMAMTHGHTYGLMSQFDKTNVLRTNYVLRTMSDTHKSEPRRGDAQLAATALGLNAGRVLNIRVGVGQGCRVW